MCACVCMCMGVCVCVCAHARVSLLVPVWAISLCHPVRHHLCLSHPCHLCKTFSKTETKRKFWD